MGQKKSAPAAAKETLGGPDWWRTRLCDKNSTAIAIGGGGPVYLFIGGTELFEPQAPKQLAMQVAEREKGGQYFWGGFFCYPNTYIKGREISSLEVRYVNQQRGTGIDEYNPQVAMRRS